MGVSKVRDASPMPSAMAPTSSRHAAGTVIATSIARGTAAIAATSLSAAVAAW
jgi:hypothetical protein